MPKYRVRVVDVSAEAVVCLEADSPQEAERIAIAIAESDDEAGYIEVYTYEDQSQWEATPAQLLPDDVVLQPGRHSGHRFVTCPECNVAWCGTCGGPCEEGDSAIKCSNCGEYVPTAPDRKKEE